MYKSLNHYRAWNAALLKYFFPIGNEDAILYLDENVLVQIACEANLQKAENLTWTDYLLSSTLLTGEAFNSFVSGWAGYTGNNISSVGKAKSWPKLVEELSKLKFADGTPAYFAMLCSIMLLASIAGADHSAIKKVAEKYLGAGYSKKTGELIEPLLQQLHKDKYTFNANRLCGKQRHMGRIRYHLVLRKEQREDFIDFLEVNDLKWGYETYEFFINNTLVPALDKAHKTELLKFVIEQGNISYVKNILRSDLNYGKPAEASKFGNTLQEKEIKWKYALEIDYSGELCFSIVCDYNNTPFNIVLDNNTFKVDSDNPFSEVIAQDVSLESRIAVTLSHNKERYVFSNLSADKSTCLYFEKIYEGYYLQVEEPQVGRQYYVFIPVGCRYKVPSSWTPVGYIQYTGYTVYDVEEYLESRKKDTPRNRAEDCYKFVQLGTWVSVNLEDGYTVFWRPNILKSEEQQITALYQGHDGKAYFKIPSCSVGHLSGDVIIKDAKQEEVYIEQVSYDFEWDGEQASYHMNGWGEITNVPINYNSTSKHSSAKLYIQNGIAETIGSEILIQVLYDIADTNGCVSSRKMVAAIEFVLSFHGIVPTIGNKKSVIYALRRLGYIISYYDINKREYINQLLSKYVEKSNYCPAGISNAYVVKGVYNCESLKKLLHNDCTTIPVFRKRPYEDDVLRRHPEYICLPDIIIYDQKGENDWARYDFQISDYMIANMENMSQFAKKFLSGGICKQYRGNIQTSPAMVKDIQGRESLCVRSSGGTSALYDYYSDGKYLRKIPKHLSRAYVQNQRDIPIAVMDWHMPSKKVKYSSLAFLSGMGVPEVLDIALCDTNLGMPSIDEVFIVDKHELGIESLNPLVERRTYSTTAMSSNNSTVLEVIKKLSGRSFTTVEECPNIVYLARSQRPGAYKLLMSKKYAYNKDLFILYWGSETLAFAIGRDTYFYDGKTQNFRRVLEQDVNTALSNIIKNRIEQLQLGEPFKGTLPQIAEKTTTLIPIIERQIL